MTTHYSVNNNWLNHQMGCEWWLINGSIVHKTKVISIVKCDILKAI